MPKGDYLRGNGPKLRWIEAHVSYTGDDCLAWPFAVNERLGRGTLSVNGKVDYAYRYMCKLAHGEQPADKPYAAHECGNGHLGCLNPKHLCWKTSSENALDRRRHGRREGANGSRTYLTPAQVTEIRSLKGIESQYALAERFRISRGSVEYWQRSTHDPAPFSTNKYKIAKRRKQPQDLPI